MWLHWGDSVSRDSNKLSEPFPLLRVLQILREGYSEPLPATLSPILPGLMLFSHSVMSDSLWPHGLQHVRLPSPPPRTCSNSCPLSQWCHATISSSVIPFSSRLQSLPASGSFPVSSFPISSSLRWPKDWSFSLGISLSSEYSGLISFRMDWFDLFAVQGTLNSPLQHHSSEASILQHSAFFMISHIHTWLLEKP